MVFQRGAADGLNIVVPYGESRYYSLRPAIDVPRPGFGDDAAVDLNGFFGLHPSLASLMPLFQAKTLAIVEAVGSPDPTRSHFDAQDFMESGTPGRRATPDGWLNRALKAQPGTVSPLRAVSLGPELPLTLRGGRVYGDWPGLADGQLYEGRDLALTTDFRDMLAELVGKQLGNRDLGSVFPGYAQPRFRNLLT